MDQKLTDDGQESVDIEDVGQRTDLRQSGQRLREKRENESETVVRGIVCHL